MKKFVIILSILAVAGCSSNAKKDAPPSQNNYPSAQNAAGNIPDTTNSINMGNKTDSTAPADSSK